MTDIYSVDETELFVELLPVCLCKYNTANASPFWSQQHKSRIAIVFCYNFDGIDKVLLSIGRYKNRRLFKNLKNLSIKCTNNN